MILISTLTFGLGEEWGWRGWLTRASAGKPVPLHEPTLDRWAQMPDRCRPIEPYRLLVHNQPPPLPELRDRLRTSLEVANISPEQMADRLAITPGIVHAWLDGRGRMKPLHMMIWASVCGVPFEWLAGAEGEKPGFRASSGGGT